MAVIAKSRFRRRSRLNRTDPFQLFLSLMLTALAAFMLLPILFLFSHALKPYHELFLFPPAFVAKQPTMDNFYDLLWVTKSSIVPAARYLFNSVLAAAANVVAAVGISVLCAFALSKHRFPGKNAFFSVIILSLMFAPETVAIPRYFVMSEIGIMNTFWAHVLPVVALPVIVFLFKQFMDQIPNELLEAGRMEGASEFGLFARIALPLCMPAVATGAILTFQASWGNIESSSFFIEDETMKTLPFFVTTLTSGLANNVARQGVAAAAALLMFLPNFAIFLFLQRKVISTMAHSGIK